MDDKCIMQNLLIVQKGICDLYLHGAIESPTPKVRTAFTTALRQALTDQDTIYKAMAAKGWYPTQEVPQPSVDTGRGKFTAAV